MHDSAAPHEELSFVGVFFAILFGLGLPALAIKGCGDTPAGRYVKGDVPITLYADPPAFNVNRTDQVSLIAKVGVPPETFSWRQVSGPKVPFTSDGYELAVVDVSQAEIPEDQAWTEFVFELTLARDGHEVVQQVVFKGSHASDGSLGIFAVNLTATPDDFVEGTVETVELRAFTEAPGPTSHATWKILRGPQLSIIQDPESLDRAYLDVTGLEVAGEVEVVVQVELLRSNAIGRGEVGVVIRPEDLHPALADPRQQIGGQSTATALFTQGEERWTLYNVANRLSITPARVEGGPVASIYLPGFIQGIAPVSYQGQDFALIAMGTKGIAVVDLSDPTAPTLVSVASVGHHQDGITYCDGGGNIVTDQTITTVNAPVVALVTDGKDLWIADEGFGIQRTSLANLLGPGGPTLGEDGTLVAEATRYTLQFAGERPWGGPASLTLHGGRLFAALRFVGLGVFDPQSLEQVGRYYLYADTSVAEDWFIGMDARTQVQSDAGDPFVDPQTGLPDYRQAAFEITQVWHGDVVAPTPWADFDDRGKWYYQARHVEVVDAGERTLALISYGLGGLVAVDMTGYDTADAGDGFLTGTYLGGVPAFPAHGPIKPTGTASGGGELVDLQGVGSLEEGGVAWSVCDGTHVFYVDHFAGLVALPLGAIQTDWHGPAAPYDNDDPTLADGVLGDHWPRWEYVTQFDMTKLDPTEEESPPIFVTQSPFVLFTADLGGHPATLLPVPGGDHGTAGTLDFVLALGAGGVAYLDVTGFAGEPTERFAILKSYATTDEQARGGEGELVQQNIGHTGGVAASEGYLYVADGPHGITAWRIRDAEGLPTDDVRLVGNTFQSEHALVTGETTLFPVPHAHNAIYANEHVYAACRASGLRRLTVGRVEAHEGQPGEPLLLTLDRGDIFEHSSEEFEEDVAKPLPYQDHASDARVINGLAYVADGRSGLTIYDLAQDPTSTSFDFIRANIGGAKEKPLLGRSLGVELWGSPSQGAYAFMACGPFGVGVVDISNLDQLKLVKVFQPIKLEIEGDEVRVGEADGMATDVAVAGDYVFVGYDSFGVVCYRIADLIAPLPAGVDPTELWKIGSGGELAYDHRPQAAGYLKLQDLEAYATLDGGAKGLSVTWFHGKTTLYVAYGDAGVVRVDWTDPAAPLVTHVVDTVGGAEGLCLSNGRLYVADGAGGVAVFR